jgi:hypothetical protein
MSMITTIYGDIDESELVMATGTIETSAETTTWVEYRKPGSDEIIHRSVHMTLKELPVFATAATGE